MIDQILHTLPFIQIFSLIGALLCLVAYVAHQFQWMDAKGVLYNMLNSFGSGILCYSAFHPIQAGFILMESIWLLVSLLAVIKAFQKS